MDIGKSWSAMQKLLKLGYTLSFLDGPTHQVRYCQSWDGEIREDTVGESEPRFFPNTPDYFPDGNGYENWVPSQQEY